MCSTLFEVCRYSVAIQFAVDVLSAALGSAARDDDGERLIFHQFDTLKKAVNESLADGGHFHAAADDGKNVLFLSLAVLLGVERPLINRERNTLFHILHPLAFGLGEAVDLFLIGGINVGFQNLHDFLSGTVAVPALKFHDAESCPGVFPRQSLPSCLDRLSLVNTQ